MFRTFNNYLSLVKFSHTIFALPFALIGFTLGVYSEGATFSWKNFFLVILCMVFARSAAMAFNRFIDRKFDARNTRTANREIPAGVISPAAALTLVIVCSIAFIYSAYLINFLCFVLSPLALLIILGYSYTKRFTAFCHLVLGLGLALAPVGAYIAVTGAFATLPVVFGCIVLFWVSGFDIIYALQDEGFDRSQNLRSIPVKMGAKQALLFSRSLHTIVALLVIAIYFTGRFHWLYIPGAAIFISLLVLQHRLVKAEDLSKVNMAFATSNGVASVLYAVFVCADLLLLS